MKTIFPFLCSLIFLVNYASTQEVIVKDNGNVGIGVTDPLHKLHVFGNGSFNDQLRLNNTATNLYTEMRFSSEGSFRLLNFNEGALEFWTSDNGNFTNQRMVVDKNGNVGIGIQFPLDKLHIEGGNLRIDHQRQLLFEGANASTFPSSIQMNGPSLYVSNNTPQGSISFFTMPDQSSSINALDISSDGKVGIGGVTANEMLEVGGTSKVFFGNGGFSARKGLEFTGYVNSSQADYSQLQPWNYSNNSAMNLALNASGGSVGVGTTLPLARLHVANGSLRLDFNRAIEFQNNAQSQSSLIGKDLSGNLIMQHKQAGQSLQFWTSAVQDVHALRMLIQDDGNIGIATGLPNELLEIGGNGRAFFGNGNGSNRKGLLIDGLEGSNAARLEAYDYALSTGMDLALNSFGGGNVGIGTFTPQSKLHIVNGDVRLDNNERLLFESSSGDDDGNIWVGTNNHFEIANFSGQDLHLSTSATSSSPAFQRLTVKATGNVGISTSNPTAKFSVNGSANKPGGGSWAVFSDLRSKTNISPYRSGLDQIMLLNPVSFIYKSEFEWGDDRHVGLIAQEVEEVAPSMVAKKEVKDIKDFREVDPNELTYMLINAVKELKAENEELRNRISKLETSANQ